MTVYEALVGGCANETSLTAASLINIFFSDAIKGILVKSANKAKTLGRRLCRKLRQKQENIGEFLHFLAFTFFNNNFNGDFEPAVKTLSNKLNSSVCMKTIQVQFRRRIALH